MRCCCGSKVEPNSKDELGNSYIGSKNIKGQRNGSGKLILIDGRTFSGHFKNGKAAKGVIDYPNGDMFDGSISYTFQPVVGVMTWCSGPQEGCIYKGSFSQSSHLPHGSRGIMVMPNQSIYDGEFYHGTMQGQGILQYGDDIPFVDRFEGTFVNSTILGEGKMLFRDGTIHEGMWSCSSYLNPIRQGRGKTLYPTGDTYDGNWSRDMRQGYGIAVYDATSSNKRRKSFNSSNTSTNSSNSSFSSTAGDIDCTDTVAFDGESQSGLVRRRSFDGTSGKMSHNAHCKKSVIKSVERQPQPMKSKKYIYEGQWHENKRHGKGKETLPSGGYYNGEWSNDLRHGNGEYLFPDGRLYDCQYDSGVQGKMSLKADGSTKVSQAQHRKESCLIS